MCPPHTPRTGRPDTPQPQGHGTRAGSRAGWVPLRETARCCRGSRAWVPPGWGLVPLTPTVSLCSGQKYLTAVVKVFGPLTRNYYIRAILHAA